MQDFLQCSFHISNFPFLPFSDSFPVYLHLTSKNSIFPSISVQSSRSLSKSPRHSNLKLWLHVCKHQPQKLIKKKKQTQILLSLSRQQDLFESQPRREVSLCKIFKLPIWWIPKKIKVQRVSGRAGAGGWRLYLPCHWSLWVCVSEVDVFVCRWGGRALSAPPSFLPLRANRLPLHFNYTHTHTYTHPFLHQVSPSIQPHPLSPTPQRRVTPLLCPHPLSPLLHSYSFEMFLSTSQTAALGLTWNVVKTKVKSWLTKMCFLSELDAWEKFSFLF